jgi:hypothetical protein
MHEYAAAASATEDATRWLILTLDECRRSGALFIQALCNKDLVAELLTNDDFEGAIETGLIAGRGMVVSRALAPLNRDNFDGQGIDLTSEFKKLSTDQRHLGDTFSMLLGVVPSALRIVSMSHSDPIAAIAAARRVASVCRQLSEDTVADQDLWRTAADLFERSSVENANAKQILAPVQAIEGSEERAVVLKVLATLLASWHAAPDEAIHFQLQCIDVLEKWFNEAESVKRRILLPYIESFWQYASREARFAFRSPDLTVSSIEAAMTVPENMRIHAILCAAASGFHIRGLADVLHRLRPTSANRTDAS